MRLKITVLFALIAADALSQNTATVMSSPRFIALDNNGAVVPLAELCSYYSGTLTPKSLYADSGGVTALSNPVVMDGGGQALVFGEGNYTLVLSQPGTGTCPGTGAQIWSASGIFLTTQNPTFGSVTATTFNSTATGATSAIQQQGGTFSITGAGNAAFQTVSASTTFNSLATDITAAFQTVGGTFEIFGNGNIQGQQLAGNQGSLVGFAGPPASNGCTACAAPAAGSALVYYDTMIGALRYNLGGAGWVNWSVPGSNSQVIYNKSGGFAASSGLTYNDSTDVMLITGTTTSGYQAPAFSSTNTGTNVAFTTGTGTFSILGNGNGAFQSVTAGSTAKTMSFLTGTNANTDSAGTVNLSGGTYILSFPSGHTYTQAPYCVAGESDTSPHAVGVVATTTGLTFYGTGTDTVQYICMGTVY